MSDDVAREWSRLEAWLRSNAPPLHARLAPGATAEGLARTEERLGRPLPPQVRESFARHDGGGFWLAHVEGELLALERAVETWSMLNGLGWGRRPDLPNEGRASGPVRPLWWHDGWLPFVGTKNLLCLDLDPAPGGQLGQIIEYLSFHERRTVLHPGIGAWLAHWADALERGEYTFDPERERLTRRDGAAPR